MNPAVSGISRNPLVPVRSHDMRHVPPGGELRMHAPSDGAFMCRVNGEWVLREDWGRPVMFGDVIEWYEVPQGKDNLRGLLQIVVTIVGAVIGGPAGIAITTFGNLVIGFAMAPDLPQQLESQSVSPTYTTGLAGNKARPFEAIPKVCGRHLAFPPFACEPFFRYDAYRTDSEGKEVGGDQYYYALFAVGVGDHRIERAQFDDTILSHYSDVLTATYLPPGARPVAVDPTIITASEVIGQEMLPSIAIGGFVVCNPHNTTKRIEYDILCPNGLGQVNAESGAMMYHSVRWRIDVREVDEFGVAISTWVTRDTQTLTAGTRQPRRMTYTVDLPASIRAEVRIIRLDVKEDNDRFINTVVWSGLRAKVDQGVPLNPDVAHYELVLRASQQLSQVTQNRFNLIGWGLIRCVESFVGGVVTWSEKRETRLAADWLLELATSTTWGLGRDVSKIDVQAFLDLREISIARQDRFDFVFDTSMDAWSAMQMIARTARARVFRRSGVLTVARDQWDDMPVTAFTHGNAYDMKVTETLPRNDTPDGIIIEYFDYRSWTWLTIDCPAPGVTTMTNPTREKLVGVVGPKHAKREGLYEAAQRTLRTRVTECRTEMEGILPAYMSVVRWLPDVPGYGQVGDIVSFDPTSLVMRLSEPVAWVAAAPMVISVRRPDGSYTDPAPIVQGAATNEVVLTLPLDFELTGLDSGTSERPTFMVGVLDKTDELVKITSIGDGGQQGAGVRMFAIQGIIDDIRVHEADNDYLPAPGEIQDPIDPADEVPDGGQVVPIPRLEGGPVTGFAWKAGIEFRPTGMLWAVFSNVAWNVIPEVDHRTSPNEWVLAPPIEPAAADLFEVFFTYSLVSAGKPDDSYADPYVEGTTGTWLPLNVNQRFSVVLDNPPGHPGEGFTYWGRFLFNFQIRDIATQEIQASSSYIVEAQLITGGGS